jgi:UDP-N-acetyl-D-mannosaminuronic acid dehydrogenase
MERICVVGLGYVGLPTAIVAAQSGHHVVGFDIDEKKVACINQAHAPVHEPELSERLATVLTTKRFYATTTLPKADCFIIAVPTPLGRNCSADVTAVFSAVALVIKQLESGNVIVIESTIPVGTTDIIAKMVAQKTGFVIGKDIFVAHCPERVWPSQVFHEIIHNDRVIGGVTPACATTAAHIYRKFVQGTIICKNAVFAELIKLAENSAIDVSVALAHQIATLAEELHIDPYELIEIANKHPRVKIATPTCGVGGHCVAVDPWFLIQTYPHKTRLLQSARLVNDERPHQVIHAIKKAVAQWKEKNSQRTCTVHLLGITYKANVDDLRESPALTVAQTMAREQNITCLVSDPYIAQEKLNTLFGSQGTNLHEGLMSANIVVVLVAHDQFKLLNLIDKQVLDFSGLQLHRRIQPALPEALVHEKRPQHSLTA